MRDAAIQILLIEDNPGDVRLLREALNEAPHERFEIEHVDRLTAGIEVLRTRKPDVVLLDLGLPDCLGMRAFETVHAHAPEVAIVVLTSLRDETTAIHTVQRGAQDYVVKGDLHGTALTRAIRYAVERQRLLQRLEQQARELERGRARVQFMQILAHELRNPMGVAKAILTLSRQTAKIRPLDHLVEKLSIAEREIDHVSYLLTEVLEAFRAEKERLDSTFAPIDLLDVVRAVLVPFRAADAERTFVLHDPGNGVCGVLGDSTRLAQVIRNLLDNAIKYSPPASGVTVALRADAAEARVTVSDRGMGIPEDQLPAVFDGFYRARNVTARDDVHGLGLGLFICREIVTQHGGRIWAQNNPDGGASVHFALPRA